MIGSHCGIFEKTKKNKENKSYPSLVAQLLGVYHFCFFLHDYVQSHMSSHILYI